MLITSGALQALQLSDFVIVDVERHHDNGIRVAAYWQHFKEFAAFLDAGDLEYRNIDTLTRYTHACGIKKPAIALY